jgi:hypothetical protein
MLLSYVILLVTEWKNNYLLKSRVQASLAGDANKLLAKPNQNEPSSHFLWHFQKNLPNCFWPNQQDPEVPHSLWRNPSKCIWHLTSTCSTSGNTYIHLNWITDPEHTRFNNIVQHSHFVHYHHFIHRSSYITTPAKPCSYPQWKLSYCHFWNLQTPWFSSPNSEWRVHVNSLIGSQKINFSLDFKYFTQKVINYCWSGFAGVGSHSHSTPTFTHKDV